MTKKVLFICIHNASRSQMAEAYLNYFDKDKFIAESAGLEPGKLNQFVIRAMLEDGIDISKNRCKSVQEFLDNRTIFDYAITVCDGASGERCPIFPGNCKRLHIEFKDPSQFKGSEEEIMQQVRNVRDEIKASVIEFIKENSE